MSTAGTPLTLGCRSRSAVRPPSSDPRGLQRPRQHVEGLVEIVRAPDQLVLRRDAEALVVAAVGEDAVRVEVALDERACRRLAGRPIRGDLRLPGRGRPA